MKITVQIADEKEKRTRWISHAGTAGVLLGAVIGCSDLPKLWIVASIGLVCVSACIAEKFSD